MLDPAADIAKAKKKDRGDGDGGEVAADAVRPAEKGVIYPEGEVVCREDEDGQTDINKGFAKDEADVEEPIFNNGVTNC